MRIRNLKFYIGLGAGADLETFLTGGTTLKNSKTNVLMGAHFQFPSVN